MAPLAGPAAAAAEDKCIKKKAGDRPGADKQIEGGAATIKAEPDAILRNVGSKLAGSRAQVFAMVTTTKAFDLEQL